MSTFRIHLTHPGISLDRLTKNLTNSHTRIKGYTTVVLKMSVEVPPLHISDSLEIIRQTVNKWVNKLASRFWQRRVFEFIQRKPHMHTQTSKTDSGYSVMGTRSHPSVSEKVVTDGASHAAAGFKSNRATIERDTFNQQSRSCYKMQHSQEDINLYFMPRQYNVLLECFCNGTEKTLKTQKYVLHPLLLILPFHSH